MAKTATYLHERISSVLWSTMAPMEKKVEKQNFTEAEIDVSAVELKKYNFFQQ